MRPSKETRRNIPCGKRSSAVALGVGPFDRILSDVAKNVNGLLHNG